jgi:putative NADH-flavin reductase
MTRNPPFIALAGPTGDLGERILKALVARGAAVRALVRGDASEAVTHRIASLAWCRP